MNDDYLVAAGNGELRIYDLNSASIGISKIITNAYDNGSANGNGNNGSGYTTAAPTYDDTSRSPILKIFGGQWVIVGGGGKTLSIINIHTAKAISTILTPFERVRALDFTKENKLVVTSVDTGALALLDMRIPRNVYKDLREWTKLKFSDEAQNNVHDKCTTYDETSNEAFEETGEEDANVNGTRIIGSCVDQHTSNHHVDDDDDDDNENEIDNRDRRRRVLQATSSIAIAALGCLLLKCGRRFLNRI